MSLKLKAEHRKRVGKKFGKIRKSGQFPAIVYGHKEKSLPIFLDYVKFQKVFREAGENTIVELVLGDSEVKNVLIKDVQRDPVSDRFIHADFYAVKMTEKIKAKIPLEYIGISSAVKEKAGILVKNITELEVEALPKDLPKVIEVNITTLKEFSDVIKVKDLIVGPGVIVLAKAGEIVSTTTPPRSEEELKALEEKPTEDVESVEGVKKEEPVPEGEAVAEGGKPSTPAAKGAGTKSAKPEGKGGKK